MAPQPLYGPGPWNERIHKAESPKLLNWETRQANSRQLNSNNHKHWQVSCPKTAVAKALRTGQVRIQPQDCASLSGSPEKGTGNVPSSPLIGTLGTLKVLCQCCSPWHHGPVWLDYFLFDHQDVTLMILFRFEKGLRKCTGLIIYTYLYMCIFVYCYILTLDFLLNNF